MFFLQLLVMPQLARDMYFCRHASAIPRLSHEAIHVNVEIPL
jgi:hypothetical protein